MLVDAFNYATQQRHILFKYIDAGVVKTMSSDHRNMAEAALFHKNG